VILGTGSARPKHRVSNDELAERVDTSDEWIASRTGIRQRHIAGDGETTSDLGAAAALKALAAAGCSAQDIDLVIVATATPDFTFPATATVIQNKLGITRGAAFDVQAVCAGFVYAIATADNFLARGQFERALVIGAETFSRILDWSDRGTCVLFGDGAGALVLERTDMAKAKGRGVKASHLRSDGRYRELLYVDGGPSTTQTVGHLRCFFRCPCAISKPAYSEDRREGRPQVLPAERIRLGRCIRPDREIEVDVILPEQRDALLEPGEPGRDALALPAVQTEAAEKILQRLALPHWLLLA
jgi:3-oxoacyl-[acyl-carrier-protein] synthase III